jgi:hypothetical protein
LGIPPSRQSWAGRDWPGTRRYSGSSRNRSVRGFSFVFTMSTSFEASGRRRDGPSWEDTADRILILQRQTAMAGLRWILTIFPFNEIKGRMSFISHLSLQICKHLFGLFSACTVYIVSDRCV